ncbi:hypothetical protein ACMXYX_04140 [Neptuniibacter sp. QD72_48]|uniref:hypothetical protein n=1 Tax=unclassified Neptuniibacter TaxID=2630693 RepID=UPI0039F52C82
MTLRKTLITAFAILISNSAFADQNRELVQNYLNSFGSRDAQGIFNLINWEGVDKESRRSLQKYIKSGFKGRQIRRIFIEPIAEGTNPSYVQDGKTYELNLKPSGQLNIVFIDNKNKRSTTKMYVGEHKGSLLIGSAVVAPEELACNAPKIEEQTC